MTGLLYSLNMKSSLPISARLIRSAPDDALPEEFEKGACFTIIRVSPSKSDAHLYSHRIMSTMEPPSLAEDMLFCMPKGQSARVYYPGDDADFPDLNQSIDLDANSINSFIANPLSI